MLELFRCLKWLKVFKNIRWQHHDERQLLHKFILRWTASIKFGGCGSFLHLDTCLRVKQSHLSWCSSNCPKWMMRSSISFLSYYITATTRSIVILKVQLLRRIKNVLRSVTGDTKTTLWGWNAEIWHTTEWASVFFLCFFSCKRSKTAMEIHSLLHFERYVQPSSCVSSKYGM